MNPARHANISTCSIYLNDRKTILYKSEFAAKRQIVFDFVRNDIQNVFPNFEIGLQERDDILAVIRVHPHAVL